MSEFQAGWLDQKGCIVLGERQADERVNVTLAADAAGQLWLNEIPEAQRETTRRAVISVLAEAGMRIKQILVQAQQTGPTNG